jgi:TolB-like protein
MEKSIAVLPFVDLSEKHDQGYFADGVAEELVDLLTQVSDLHVAARTSSFHFKGKSDDVATIAQTLRVTHVLEGSVRKAGDTLRVTVQLVRADDGYHVWSQTYERNVTDIFKIQDEIATAVVETLKVRLLPTQRFVNQHHTANLEAYTQYLLGNQFRIRDTPETNSQALAAYQRAVDLDPGYAAAYSGLALTEWRIADQSTADEAAYGRALAAADKAIALAPASSDGYWARGTLRYVYFFDWDGAQADFDKALALDANDVRTMVSYGRLLATLGRIPDATAMTRKAIALDPLSVEAWDWLPYYLLCSGQMAAAREGAKRALDINPAATGSENPWIVPLFTDGPRAARAALSKRFRESALFGTAVVEHSLGNASESQRALELLIHERAYTWAFQIAAVYAWRGENDRAFDWLDRAYRQHDAGMTRLTLDPLLRGLRGDPRFKALVHKMNLPQ